MDEPIWIRQDVVLVIHQRQLAEHGGGSGVRDTGTLESALARPQNLFACSQGKPDLAALAASYAFGIVKNHPFVDGNKRTGYVVCRTFPLLNGCDMVASQEEKYITFLSLAEGRLDEQSLAMWIRSRLTPVKG